MQTNKNKTKILEAHGIKKYNHQNPLLRRLRSWKLEKSSTKTNPRLSTKLLGMNRFYFTDTGGLEVTDALWQSLILFWTSWKIEKTEKT